MRTKFTIIISSLIILSFLCITLLFSGCVQNNLQINDNNTQTLNNEVDANKPVVVIPAETEMVDCTGKTDADPFCFITRMNQCLPVTVKMTGNDNTTEIVITVLGIVNNTCHFQRTINKVMDLDCYFPKGTMNEDTLNQTFGTDKGLQKVVDDACKRPGW